jgi:pimeloyl-ACP methyl ester carboxylesterase
VDDTQSPSLGYCPHDLDSDPAVLGLVDEAVDTRFGKMYAVRSPQRTSDMATLFLHGVGGRWTTWTPFLRAARAVGAPVDGVVAVDVPGFGRSENRLNHLESLQVAAEIGRYLSDLGYTRARIVGHSMGGLLALDMAARPQLEVVSLHLVAGSAFAIIDAINHPIGSLARTPFPASLFWLQYAVARSGVGTSLARFAYRRGVLAPLLWPLIAHPSRFKPRALEALVREMRPRSFRYAAANVSGYDAQARWQQITCPVHAVFGARDHLVAAPDRTRLAKVCPAARISVVDDAAHFLHIERPYELTRRLGL